MKTYTENQLINALKLQKADDYQVAGNFLISDKPDIGATLDSLANDIPMSVKQVDDFLMEWEIK